MSSVSNTALSGLNAANQQLSVISNNIANSNTTGFKSAVAKFADVYAQNGAVGSQVGLGVKVAGVVQDFTEGSLTLTGKTLDLSISNNDFFVLGTPAGGQTYTRSGSFSTDSSGNIVDVAGNKLKGYAYSGTGAAQVLTSTLAPLTISTTAAAPSATTSATTKINLDSSATVPATAVFNPADPTSYNSRSDLTVYDSLGNSHTLTSFYVKTAVANTWNLHSYLDQGTAAQLGPSGGDTVPANNFATMVFNSSGAITGVGLPVAATPTSRTLTFAIANGATAPLTIEHNFASSTQYASTTAVSSSTQDGYTSGKVTSISVSTSGVISANYSNGTTNNLGKVVTARFTNPQGLQILSDNQWVETSSSGTALIQSANSDSAIRSGNLENSNVDLAKNLVDLISAQRYFQANTQAIQVANTTLDAIINIR